jgi:ferredoxin-NADP reductase
MQNAAQAIVMPEPLEAAATASVPATLTVRVRALTWEAPGVVSLDLVAPEGGALPLFDPGAHIDVHLPNGQIRQYSLCGDTADTSHYRIAVRDVKDGLASQFVHRKLRPGDLITISAPRNNFPLVDAPGYIFIAGGIGITPMLPMMRQANAQGRPWILFYCNRKTQDAPFLDEIHALGGQLSLHCSSAGTRLDVASEFATTRPDTVIYCCGPERLMTAVEEATAGWPEDCVRFEWFTPRSRPADEVSGAFEIVCEASGLTLQVPPDKAVLAVLNEAGIEVPCSCEQGICGTCEVRVISGEVDHRDSILSSSERAANASMMTCVSRALGSRLVLDI